MAIAERPSGKVVQILNGLWVELRDLDPVQSNRQVRHIWLHRGALVFDVQAPSPASPYRDGITYFGLPVRFLIRKENGDWHIRDIDKTKPKRVAFHLTRNVFCPGESSEIVRKGKCLSGASPVGEGYIFDFAPADLDKDGQPDKKSGLDYYAVGIELDSKTASDLEVDRRFTFDIYERELDQLEKDGIVFRLDRTHPQHEIKFLGSAYQPCGSQKSSKIVKTVAVEAYARAEGKSEVGFWSWLKASFSVGASASAGTTDTDVIQVTSTTSDGTVFRQWGIIFDHSVAPDDPAHETAFYLKKVFECSSNQGEIRFGDKIKRVEIGIQNQFTGKTDATEFSQSTDLQKLDRQVFDAVDKPVFISINSSDEQAAVLDAIKSKLAREEHHLAALVFAELNLACPEKDREKCLQWSTLESR